MISGGRGGEGGRFWTLYCQKQNVPESVTKRTKSMFAPRKRNSSSVGGWKGGSLFANSVQCCCVLKESMRIAFCGHAFPLKQHFIVESRRLQIISETIMTGSDMMRCANSTCKSACQDSPHSWQYQNSPV